MGEIPADNMPLHFETKGVDREELKEDISVPAPFEKDQEREQLPLPSLHKAANPYKLPIPSMCHPREDNGDKQLKLKDPGRFMVNIIIGSKKMAQEMLDLGASINIIPYSVYLRLRLGKLELTPMTLQLADRSIKCPNGIMEDLLV